MNFTLSRDGKSYFTGMYDADERYNVSDAKAFRKWVHSDGTEATYFGFMLSTSPTEPSNPTDRCINIRKTFDYGWTDINCRKRRSSVCERPLLGACNSITGWHAIESFSYVQKIF